MQAKVPESQSPGDGAPVVEPGPSTEKLPKIEKVECPSTQAEKTRNSGDLKPGSIAPNLEEGDVPQKQAGPADVETQPTEGKDQPKDGDSIPRPNPEKETDQPAKPEAKVKRKDEGKKGRSSGEKRRTRTKIRTKEKQAKPGQGPGSGVSKALVHGAKESQSKSQPGPEPNSENPAGECRTSGEFNIKLILPPSTTQKLNQMRERGKHKERGQESGPTVPAEAERPVRGSPETGNKVEPGIEANKGGNGVPTKGSEGKAEGSKAKASERQGVLTRRMAKAKRESVVVKSSIQTRRRRRRQMMEEEQKEKAKEVPHPEEELQEERPELSRNDRSSKKCEATRPRGRPRGSTKKKDQLSEQPDREPNSGSEQRSPPSSNQQESELKAKPPKATNPEKSAGTMGLDPQKAGNRNRLKEEPFETQFDEILSGNQKKKPIGDVTKAEKSGRKRKRSKLQNQESPLLNSETFLEKMVMNNKGTGLNIREIEGLGPDLGRLRVPAQRLGGFSDTNWQPDPARDEIYYQTEVPNAFETKSHVKTDNLPREAVYSGAHDIVTMDLMGNQQSQAGRQPRLATDLHQQTQSPLQIKITHARGADSKDVDYYDLPQDNPENRAYSARPSQQPPQNDPKKALFEVQRQPVQTEYLREDRRQGLPEFESASAPRQEYAIQSLFGNRDDCQRIEANSASLNKDGSQAQLQSQRLLEGTERGQFREDEERTVSARDLAGQDDPSIIPMRDSQYEIQAMGLLPNNPQPFKPPNQSSTPADPFDRRNPSRPIQVTLPNLEPGFEVGHSFNQTSKPNHAKARALERDYLPAERDPLRNPSEERRQGKGASAWKGFEMETFNLMGSSDKPPMKNYLEPEQGPDRKPAAPAFEGRHRHWEEKQALREERPLPQDIPLYYREDPRTREARFEKGPELDQGYSPYEAIYRQQQYKSHNQRPANRLSLQTVQSNSRDALENHTIEGPQLELLRKRHYKEVYGANPLQRTANLDSMAGQFESFNIPQREARKPGFGEGQLQSGTKAQWHVASPANPVTVPARPGHLNTMEETEPFGRRKRKTAQIQRVDHRISQCPLMPSSVLQNQGQRNPNEKDNSPSEQGNRNGAQPAEGKEALQDSEKLPAQEAEEPGPVRNLYCKKQIYPSPGLEDLSGEEPSLKRVKIHSNPPEKVSPPAPSLRRGQRRANPRSGQNQIEEVQIRRQNALQPMEIKSEELMKEEKRKEVQRRAEPPNREETLVNMDIDVDIEIEEQQRAQSRARTISPLPRNTPVNVRVNPLVGLEINGHNRDELVRRCGLLQRVDQMDRVFNNSDVQNGPHSTQGVDQDLEQQYQHYQNYKTNMGRFLAFEVAHERIQTQAGIRRLMFISQRGGVDKNYWLNYYCSLMRKGGTLNNADIIKGRLNCLSYSLKEYMKHYNHKGHKAVFDMGKFIYRKTKSAVLLEDGKNLGRVPRQAPDFYPDEESDYYAAQGYRRPDEFQFSSRYGHRIHPQIEAYMREGHRLQAAYDPARQGVRLQLQPNADPYFTSQTRKDYLEGNLLSDQMADLESEFRNRPFRTAPDAPNREIRTINQSPQDRLEYRNFDPNKVSRTEHPPLPVRMRMPFEQDQFAGRVGHPGEVPFTNLPLQQPEANPYDMPGRQAALRRNYALNFQGMHPPDRSSALTGPDFSPKFYEGPMIEPQQYQYSETPNNERGLMLHKGPTGRGRLPAREGYLRLPEEEPLTEPAPARDSPGLLQSGKSREMDPRKGLMQPSIENLPRTEQGPYPSQDKHYMNSQQKMEELELEIDMGMGPAAKGKAFQEGTLKESSQSHQNKGASKWSRSRPRRKSRPRISLNIQTIDNTIKSRALEREDEVMADSDLNAEEAKEVEELMTFKRRTRSRARTRDLLSSGMIGASTDKELKMKMEMEMKMAEEEEEDNVEEESSINHDFEEGSPSDQRQSALQSQPVTGSVAVEKEGTSDLPSGEDPDPDPGKEPEEEDEPDDMLKQESPKDERPKTIQGLIKQSSNGKIIEAEGEANPLKSKDPSVNRVVPSEPADDDNSKEWREYFGKVDYQALEPGTRAYHKISRNFSFPLKDVLEMQDKFNQELFQRENEDMSADLRGLNRSTPFSKYLITSPFVEDFKSDHVALETTQHSRELVRKLGHLRRLVSQNFGFNASLCDMEKFLKLHKNFANACEIIQRQCEATKRYLSDIRLKRLRVEVSQGSGVLQQSAPTEEPLSKE